MQQVNYLQASRHLTKGGKVEIHIYIDCITKQFTVDSHILGAINLRLYTITKQMTLAGHLNSSVRYFKQ